MRITIANLQTGMVLQVFEGAPADLIQMLTEGWELLNAPMFTWFVTVAGEMPIHAQHDGHGLIAGHLGSVA